MTQEAKIFDLAEYRERGATIGAKSRLSLSIVPIVDDSPDGTPEPAPAEFTDLYPDGLDPSTRFGAAIFEVDGALRNLQAARDALQDERTFESDDRVMEAALHVLRCHRFRDIGDGWGPLVVAIHAAISNRTDVISDAQADLLLRTVRLLRIEPRMSFDQAMDAIDRLDAAGFAVEPKAIQVLGDCL